MGDKNRRHIPIQQGRCVAVEVNEFRPMLTGELLQPRARSLNVRLRISHPFELEGCCLERQARDGGGLLSMFCGNRSRHGEHSGDVLVF